MSKRLVDLHRKIAVLGDVGVGKSSLAERYTTGKFVDNYEPTIEHTYSKTFMYNNKYTKMHLDIVDTAGVNDYSSSLTRYSTVGINCYIFVFSLSSKNSFDKIRVIYDLLMSTLGSPPSIPIVLCGTMCDLQEQRVISIAQGRQLAKEFDAPYIECSSKTGANIDHLFSEALRLVDIDMDTTSHGSDSGEHGRATGCTIM